MDKSNKMNSCFRIEEYQEHFRISKKEKVKRYWEFLWLYPLFVKNTDEVWHVILKDGSQLNVRNCFQFDKYRFKTKQECIEWIENYKKYPIYHYL